MSPLHLKEKIFMLGHCIKTYFLDDLRGLLAIATKTLVGSLDVSFFQLELLGLGGGGRAFSFAVAITRSGEAIS